MFFGPGINWFSWGAPDITPPSSDFWCARTGDSSMQGGQIDIRSILILATLGSFLC